MAGGYVSTSGGNTPQPLQWSSEYTDTVLGLVYYNYRQRNSQKVGTERRQFKGAKGQPRKTL